MADEIVARYRLETEAAAANARKLADANDKVTKSGVQAQGSLDKMGQSAANMGRQLAGALGVTAGIAGVVMVLKSAGAAMIDFEYQMAKVKAVTGATDAEFKQLETDAKRLGASTKFTATEVGQLQEEYAKLGYTTPEIIKATEATLLLATATGSTLAQAAEVAGSVIKQFGLDASETQRVADVMAASFNKSALGMEDFAEAMKYVGPLARAANVDVETTSALLGKLADAGLKGSIAGTSLANLLTKLADANSDVSKAIGFNVNSSEDLFKALKALEGANIDLTAATELTDERSKKAFLTLLRGVDSAKQLSIELRDVEGATKAMADTMSDTAEGGLQRLINAWDGFVQALNETGAMRATFDFFAAGITGLTYLTGALDKSIKSQIDAETATRNSKQALEDYNALVKNATSDENKLAIVRDALSTQMSIYNKNLDAVRVEEEKLAKVRERQAQLTEQFASTAAGAARVSLDKQLTAAQAQANSHILEIDRLNRMNNARGEYIKLLQKAAAVEGELSNESSDNQKEQIRNIFFLTNAIKALNEERAKEGTTVERIKAINQELIPLQAELDALLGKQKDKVTEVDQAYKEWLETLEKFEQGIKKMQDNKLEMIDLDAERDKLIALRTIGGGTEEQQQALADRLNEIERDRLQKRIDMLKSFGRETIDEQVKMAEMEVSTANDIYAQMEADYQKFLEGQDADYAGSLEYRKRQLEEFAQFEDELQQERITLMNGLADFIMSSTDRLNQYQINVEQQRVKDIDKLLKQGVIDEEEADRRKRAIARQQAKRNKEVATFNAIIGTAQAVVNAMATAPNYIVGAIFAALAGIAGGIEIATIQSEPLPSFGKGGWVEGKKHSEGGTMIEAEKGEFIVSAAAAKRYAPILEQINKQTFQPPKDGWDGLAASISLNSQFTDRNLLVAIDRHREAETSVLRELLKEIKTGRTQLRGGYRA